MKYMYVDNLLASHFEETQDFNKLRLTSDTLTFNKKEKTWNSNEGLIEKINIDPATFYNKAYVELPVKLKYINHITSQVKEYDVTIALHNPTNLTGSVLRVKRTRTYIYCDNLYTVVFIDNYLIVLNDNGSFEGIMYFKEYLHQALDNIDETMFPEYDTHSLFCELFKPSKNVPENISCIDDQDVINIQLQDGPQTIYKLGIKALYSDTLTAQLENLKETDNYIYLTEITIKEFTKLGISYWRANEPRILNFLSKYDSIFFNWRVKDLYRQLYKLKELPISNALFMLL